MPVSVGCVLLNYREGGLQPDGGYDFGPLVAALADTPRRPDLLYFCEAKHYADHGQRGLLLAAKAISDHFGVPYLGLLGYMERAPLPPAIFYNPNVLTLLPPWYGHGSHHDYHSPSGPHFAARDWALAAARDWTNASHKGREVDGGWEPDTEAMDHLIGRWVDGQGRVGGAGFHSLAELAWQACRDTPAARRPGLLDHDGRILATVNDHVDAGGGLHIDNALANDLMLPYFVPDSFQIHVPPAGVSYSDHRAVSWELRF